MDVIQQTLAVFVVMALFAGMVWWLRRRGGVRWTRARSARRMELVERMPLTQHHSLHVVRASGRTMLIAVSPSGCALLDKWEGKDEAV
jgi:flagellar biogenesis protein FliO